MIRCGFSRRPLAGLSAAGAKRGSRTSTTCPEADALYIQIREAEPQDSIDIEGGVTVDGDRHVVGLEIPDAGKRLSPADLASITIEKLPLELASR